MLARVSGRVDQIYAHVDKRTEVSEVVALRYEKFEKSMLPLQCTPLADKLILHRGIVAMDRRDR